MTRTRIVVFIALVALPVVFLIGVGAYHLWVTGWAFYAWWPMGLCLAAAYILAWRWQRQIRARQAEAPPPMHWTDRDRLAWKSVEERVRVADKVPEDKFGEPQFYFDTAQEMSGQLARVYRPDAMDPVGIVTVPEILTVIELASHDLNELARTYVPGSHLLTVDHWRTARKAIGWYRTATNAYWLASALFDPLKTAARYVAAKYGMGRPLELFQQNVILWFYAEYVRKLGFYLIELYSGWLKVGTERYRELMEAHAHEPGGPAFVVPPVDGVVAPPVVVDKKEPAEPPRTTKPVGVTIAVIGQVKAGKSSLINALLGERKAETDILPLTTEVTRYDLVAPGVPTHLVLLDTAGYGRAGAEADNLEETAEVVQGADLVMLVTHARNPARKADVDFFTRLRQWFVDRPHLRFPPALVVLTHVDLLTPAMEWAPPYDWVGGSRTKEKSMADAVAAAHESFPGIETLVPVCTAEGKQWGVKEELLPAIVALLGEAKSVALLRCLHAEADEGKVRKVFSQLWAAGRKVIDLLRAGMVR
ncbi:MAG TPA: GTPase [Gemmataceae bacterium]|nr:GTPase [Gemmataceae bacterium]